ncbi:MAG TPA: helix-turn-helix domain-containing protein [Polyangiales bacterium]
MRLSAKQVERIAAAVAEPRRFRILKQLAASAAPLSCGSITEHQKVTGATISHHLKELEAAELIHSVREGKYNLISFRRDVWEAYLATLSAL